VHLHEENRQRTIGEERVNIFRITEPLDVLGMTVACERECGTIRILLFEFINDGGPCTAPILKDITIPQDKHAMAGSRKGNVGTV
jgi:hypothetical protein